MNERPTYSNTSLATFRRCAEEYRLRYVLRRKSRARASTALRFGTLFHVALNSWWRHSGDPLAKLQAALDEIDFASETEDQDPFETVKARCLITGYTARWEHERLDTLRVEVQFRQPILGIDGDLVGAIDAIVRTPTTTFSVVDWRRVRVVEHKTTSSEISPTSDYWRNVVTLDPQVSTYMTAVRVMEYDPIDTLYDVIRKPAIVPRLATPEEARKWTKPTMKEPIPRLYANQSLHDETPEEYGKRLAEDIAGNPSRYFARVSVVRLPEDHEAHHRDVTGTVRLIQFAQRENVYPRSPGACERYGRLCEYHDVCSRVTSIDDDTRFETNTRKEFSK